jgi:LemA protein
MSVPRIIDLAVCLLLVFVLTAVVSFLSLRPMLAEFRAGAKSEWEGFVREARERNRLIPGLVEAFQAFESGHSRLAAKMLEASAVSTRSDDPARIVAAVNEMETCLTQVERLLDSSPEMGRHTPFAGNWKKIERSTYRINLARQAYNKSARAYNGLLNAFPQNLLVTVFGFVPLGEYPTVRTMADY